MLSWARFRKVQGLADNAFDISVRVVFTHLTRLLPPAVYEAALLVQMSYDEVEIEDMDWSDELQAFTYSCPCGDLFSISMARD